jgi:hypothetical protein
MTNDENAVENALKLDNFQNWIKTESKQLKGNKSLKVSKHFANSGQSSS